MSDLAVLEERVDHLEEREESTRRRLETHEAAADLREREMAKTLEAIRFDVHDIRAGKKAMVQAARLALAVLVFAAAGVIGVARWTIDHWLRDMRTLNDPTAQRSIP